MDKKKLSETDSITKFIMPSIINAGWDDMTQIRMRKTVKSADIFLYHKPSMPLAEQHRIVAQVDELMAI